MESLPVPPWRRRLLHLRDGAACVHGRAVLLGFPQALEDGKIRERNVNMARVYSTETPGLYSGDSALTPQQQAEEELVVATVLAQPHRRGNRSRQLADPLGRLCEAGKWHPTCYDAGLMYGEIVRQLRRAEGHRVIGYRFDGCGGEPIEDETLEMYKAKVRNADWELRRVMAGLPSLMVDLCYLELEPMHSIDKLKNGLVRLAVHFGMRKFFHALDEASA